MMRIICALALGALILTQTPFARAAEQVDLLLALAMDVSRRMDQPKFLLQRDGYAAVISNPQVLNAIINPAINKPTSTRRIEEKASERRSEFSLDCSVSCAWTKGPCF